MTELPFASVSVFGGGAWGTALASLVARNGIDTILWTRNDKVAQAINIAHENTTYLPGIELPHSLSATTDIAAASTRQAIIFAVPAQHGRSVYIQLARLCPDGLPVAIAAKGIEQSSLKLMPAVLLDVWPTAKPAMISGPSFAHDVARGKPTAVTLADANGITGKRWLATLRASHFRPYLNDDLAGVALGGAVKNVLAIAAGIVDGMALGESAHAALVARGFAEFQRLGLAMGARAGTMAGLSGLGDLILTASSSRSRNMSLGQLLGQGQSLEQILNGRNSVSEGVATAQAVQGLAKHFDVDMPVCLAVADIVSGKQQVGDAIITLMSRPLKAET